MLWWIKGRSQSFKSFVANRVEEIQTEMDPRQWRFVPTEKNPADLFFKNGLYGCKKTRCGLLTKWNYPRRASHSHYNPDQMKKVK